MSEDRVDTRADARIDARFDAVAETLFREQDRLVTAFEDLDGSDFRRTPWQRDGFGRGRVCVLDGGAVLERAAVNVSVVAGTRLPPSITDSAPYLLGQPFRVTGLSMVVHPANPYAPACHANFRYFSSSGSDWWFGGGIDLTPSYGFDDDATHFHRTLRDWCARHPVGDYPAWKSACDSYFTLPHRDETRGVGGVFFDRLTGSFADLWACVADGLATVLPAYLPILRRRHAQPFTERERRWQLLRRGRYVEFNLVHDRGTRFGLQTGADIDAVLVSLPPLASWEYGLVPEPGSPEADLQRFLVVQDWLRPRGG